MGSCLFLIHPPRLESINETRIFYSTFYLVYILCSLYSKNLSLWIDASSEHVLNDPSL